MKKLLGITKLCKDISYSMFYCQGENTESRKENEKNSSIFLKSTHIIVSAPHGIEH